MQVRRQLLVQARRTGSGASAEEREERKEPFAKHVAWKGRNGGSRGGASYVCRFLTIADTGVAWGSDNEFSDSFSRRFPAGRWTPQ